MLPNILNIKIPAEVIQAAATFAAVKSYRREMNFIQVRHRLGHLEIWATDAHRIFRYRRPCEPFTEFYLKAEEIQALKLGRNPEPFKFLHERATNEKNSIKKYYISDLRDAKYGFSFPDCEAVWPTKGYFWAWEFDAAQVQKIIKALLPIAGESEIFTFNWKEGRIEVDNKDFDVAIAGRAEIPGIYSDENPQLLMGGKKLRDVIMATAKAGGNNHLKMMMDENNGHIKGLVFHHHFEGHGETSFKTMLMPVDPDLVKK